MASLRGRGGQGKDMFFWGLFPSPSPPVYMDGLAFFLVVLLYASMIWMVHK